ncbi:MAG: mannose-1-phosphate guanylyltransferase [Persicimonas sp.]
MISVILAGGSGTRFWPLSRRDRPKQLVALWDDTPMIRATVERVEQVSDGDRVFVVLGDHLVDATREVLEETTFIVEPCARNTAPAIGLAAIHAQKRFGDEPIAIFPADHFIGGIEDFERCLHLADKRARDGDIVTLGIRPTRPETGYGYIRFEGGAPGSDELVARPVDEFVEKPTRRIAREYVASGDYVWNSGMFVFTPSTLFGEMERQLPEMHEAMMAIGEAIGTEREDEVTRERFAALEGISIDYGIMEGAESVAVIPATFSWSDVGHWAALDEVRPTDDDGNVVEANAHLVDVRDSVVFSENDDRLIAACGLEGMVVVDTPDALLVIPKERAQDVKQIVHDLDDIDPTVT